MPKYIFYMRKRKCEPRIVGETGEVSARTTQSDFSAATCCSSSQKVLGKTEMECFTYIKKHRPIMDYL